MRTKSQKHQLPKAEMMVWGNIEQKLVRLTGLHGEGAQEIMAALGMNEGDRQTGVTDIPSAINAMGLKAYEKLGPGFKVYTLLDGTLDGLPELHIEKL